MVKVITYLYHPVWVSISGLLALSRRQFPYSESRVSRTTYNCVHFITVVNCKHFNQTWNERSSEINIPGIFFLPEDLANSVNTWPLMDTLATLNQHFSWQLIEGLCAKRAYIEFWPIFIFCRIKLIFGRLTWSICASFSKNNTCKKTQLSSGDLLFNEKQKKPFVSLAIEALYRANVNLFCRDTSSKQGQPLFFFFFLICFSTYFKNQNIYLKKTGSQSC